MKQLSRTKLSEANPAEKILKDPKMAKMLAIAVKHDHTIPGPALARLGPKASDEDIVKMWSELIDRTLSNTNYGDLSRDGKFDNWLTKLYINHTNDYEDINGEGGDALGAWKALSVRNLLDPADQDFNRFASITQLQNVVRKEKYRTALRKIADAEKLASMKKNSKQIVLIDDDRYYVIVPLNYGSCYIFNNAEGAQGQFCTGSSSGLTWFERYSRDGPIVSIVDKKNTDDKNGKWQMHTSSRQLKNATQDYNVGEDEFADLFPGLMKKIADALSSRSEELKNASDQMDIARGGWNIPAEIDRIKRLYPTAYNSTPENTASQEEMNHLFGRPDQAQR
jgi:hypothetical protein